MENINITHMGRQEKRDTGRLQITFLDGWREFIQCNKYRVEDGILYATQKFFRDTPLAAAREHVKMFEVVVPLRNVKHVTFMEPHETIEERIERTGG